jgi:hypothetical protein
MDLRLFFAIFIVGNIIYLTQLEYITPIIRFISQFLGETVKVKTEIYMDSSLTSRPYGITLGYLERVGTSLLIMLYYKKLYDKSALNIIFVNSFIVFFVFYFYFSEVSIILTRLGNLFIFSYWIIWPKIIELSSSTTKYILIIVISIYLSLKISKTTENILYKYDNVLFGEYQSFDQREKIFLKNSLRLQMKK